MAAMALSKAEIILKHVDSGSIPVATIKQADQLSCQRQDHGAKQHDGAKHGQNVSKT